jgi:hypothetical protein
MTIGKSKESESVHESKIEQYLQKKLKGFLMVANI